MSGDKPPLFDKYGTEKLVDYMKRVDKYNDVTIKKERYNMMLDFINKWLNYDKKYQLKSLKEFKNISESTLLHDLKHNRNILRKYGTQIKEKFKFKFNIDDETDSDDIKDRYILYFVSRALNSIGYTLQCREIEHKNVVMGCKAPLYNIFHVKSGVAPRHIKNKKDKKNLLENYYTIKGQKRKPKRKNNEKIQEIKKIVDLIALRDEDMSDLFT